MSPQVALLMQDATQKTELAEANKTVTNIVKQINLLSDDEREALISSLNTKG